ncbi:MAG TPA: S9 family peptidase [Actinomycetota bacterium]|nr:S9 family peptidase [Actinomycetota bacterium]
MERDLRETPLYAEVEEHFRKALEPGFGRVTEAADPAPSPDGRSIAFTGSLWEKLEGTPKTRICVAPTDGGAFRTASSGPEHDVGARWSPDGRRLSFRSDRAEKGRMQLYLLRAEDLGEAVPLPEVEGSIEAHAWSPDGARILVRSAGMHADVAGAEGSGASEAERDLPDWVPRIEAWDDDRVWRRLWTIDVESGEVRRTGRDGLNVWEAEWCGDGAVVAVASEDPGESAWYTAPLILIDGVTGADRVLATSDVQFGIPAGVPDGSTVAAIEAPCSDRGFVSGRAVILDVANGRRRDVEVEDGDVTWLGWHTDGRLAYAGLRGTRAILGEIDPATGGRTETGATDDAVGAWDPSGATMDDGRLAIVRSGFDRSPEVAVVEGGGARTVVGFGHEGHDHLRGPTGRMERISWDAADGTEIEGLLLAPAGDGPHPLILNVHGGPVGSFPAAFPRPLYAWLVSRGYAILQPNPRGSNGRGRAFIEAVIGDMGGADAGDDLAGVDALVERGIADPDRIGVTGGSYGGFMSCWLPIVDDRFKAAVAISPVTDFYSQHWNSNIGAWDAWFLGGDPTDAAAQYRERSPVFLADRVTTPTLLTAGTEDRCTPPGQAIEFYRVLRERGVPAEVAIYPGEGHGVRKFPAYLDLVTRMTAWFERFMPAR